MKSKIILGLAGLAIIGFITYSLMGGQSPEEYAAEIQHEREQKDIFMRTAKDSPFEGSKEFGGLKYFPPDLKYKIHARLVPIENKKTVRLPTSDHSEKEYLENSFAEFELDGSTQKLLLLEMTEEGPYRGTLFLAFADETSAGETYGAGRYLELKNVKGATSIWLDFNMAYNPYCAYNDHFSCPMPPRENVLKVPIRAGEKSYH